MRVPTGISLSTYIRRLIKEDKVYLFYQTKDWKELRASVMEDNHNECIRCKKKGKVTKADCVHHVNHVRQRPDLALSRYYTDDKGLQQMQLEPLCNSCHNEQHPEKFVEYRKKDGFTNEERW